MSIFFGRIVSAGSMYKSTRRGSCHQKLPLHPRIADKPRDDLSILLHQRRTPETSGARAHHPRPSPRGTVLGLLPRRGVRGRSRSYGRRLRGGPFPSNPTGRRRVGADRFPSRPLRTLYCDQRSGNFVKIFRESGQIFSNRQTYPSADINASAIQKAPRPGTKGLALTAFSA